ncbi:hypothetical protein [Spiroplasma poulsonii]|uniref:hypothetical protein n=1 Tax=Spiroplasma poulsonii TaxID=2138 RepID=UPI001F4CAEF7|nr:hypothetical protein [Spiroplasma poulsonii]UNF61205.1 hypothetical protein MNU24_04635 [Spiroplasma poulsonii]
MIILWKVKLLYYWCYRNSQSNLKKDKETILILVKEKKHTIKTQVIVNKRTKNLTWFSLGKNNRLSFI